MQVPSAGCGVTSTASEEQFANSIKHLTRTPCRQGRAT